ncbi:MAG: transposase [Acutalibacter muris]|nr:transposase [Acutalibacter muris]
MTNAVLHLVDSGCKWRQLPQDFPPYSIVHSFYRRVRISGLWDKILEHLVKKDANKCRTQGESKLRDH